MKKILLSAAAFAVVAVSAVAVAPATSEAVPAFARQTGAACLNCHFQAIPRLAAFGRNFRMGGFRDMGEQALIEDDNLSLPAVFNASLMFKARIQNSNAVTGPVPAGTFGSGGSTALQWPDEAALLIGGRYGEHIGGLTEWGMSGKGTAGPLSYKIDFVYEIDAGTVAVAAGSTDGLGVPYVFNDPSNTISRNTRGWQFRSASLGASLMNAGATGVGLYAYLNDLIYVAVGGVAPAGGPTIANGGAGLMNGADLSTLGAYVRGAVTTEVAGLDTVVGAFYAQQSDVNKLVGTTTKASSGALYGIDAQLQGDLGDLSIGFYLPWLLKGENAGRTIDTYGFYPVLSVGFGHAGVRAGYDWAKSKAIGVGATATAFGAAATIGGSTTKKTFMLGGWYSLAQNVELDLEYASSKTAGTAAPVADVNTTTLQLEYVY